MDTSSQATPSGFTLTLSADDQRRGCTRYLRSAKGVGLLFVCQIGTMQPTLYEFAGGSDALLALATAHHARCLADPELNHPFSHEGLNPEHVQRLATYWGEVLGGPSDFSQSCGDHTSVLKMHAGNGDISDLGRRFHTCFVQAMDDARLA